MSVCWPPQDKLACWQFQWRWQWPARQSLLNSILCLTQPRSQGPLRPVSCCTGIGRRGSWERGCVWHSWNVTVQFGVGDSVSPTFVKDTEEHASLCSTDLLVSTVFQLVSIEFVFGSLYCFEEFIMWTSRISFSIPVLLGIRGIFFSNATVSFHCIENKFVNFYLIFLNYLDPTFFRATRM